ncbi:hypothetical protein BH20ACT3_BH20ACT3_09420 [soil metagenome]
MRPFTTTRPRSLLRPRDPATELVMAVVGLLGVTCLLIGLIAVVGSTVA